VSGNVFHIPSDISSHEIFTDLLIDQNIRVEQIVSFGQTTPHDDPYIQQHDEWVVILQGNAIIMIDQEEHKLSKGDSLLIPQGIMHSVIYTDNPTIWLAIHIGG
jgi:cupin 2 domain-containing protein